MRRDMDDAIQGWPYDPEPGEVIAREVRARDGRTVVLAGWQGLARGAIAVADTVKPSASAAVAGLRGLGLRTIMLTGDSEAAAAVTARKPLAVR